MLAIFVSLALSSVVVGSRTHCSNTCMSAWDNKCDDTTSCPAGSDCADCGPRVILEEPPPVKHQIVHGDTLSKIGQKYGIMGMTLQFWNRIPDPTALYSDQTIDVTYAQHKLSLTRQMSVLGETYKRRTRLMRAHALTTLFGSNLYQLGLVGGGAYDFSYTSAAPSEALQIFPRLDECPMISAQSLMMKAPLKITRDVSLATATKKFGYDMSNQQNHIWWAPNSCRPLDTVAIIVPFRKREQQLPEFLARMHPLLRKQHLRYRIFLVEQFDDKPFNRGMLLNIGAAEATKLAPRDAIQAALQDVQGGATGFSPGMMSKSRFCYVFHDVDMLPNTDATPYFCPRGSHPHHLSTTVDTFVYQCPYSEIMGGVTTFTAEQLLAINGYSNEYDNWGGEDDDLSFRVRYASNRKILRPADCLSRKGACIFDPACQDQVGIIEGYEKFDFDNTKSLISEENGDSIIQEASHPGSFIMNGGKTNGGKHSSTQVYESIFNSPIEYISSGLSTLNYELISLEHHPLYTLLKVTQVEKNNK